MRTALTMLLSTMLVSTAAFAAWDDCGCSCPNYSPTYQNQPMNQPNTQMRKTGSSDGYFLKNGKVMVFRNGNISEVSQEVTLDNGGRLMADGTIIFADGRRETLRDNQWLTIDGQISDSAAAVNRYDGNQSNFSSQQSVNQDGYFLQNGRVMMFRNGQSSQLTNETTLSDGSRIMPDGTIVMRDGTRSMLRDGQRLDFQGRTSVNASHRETQPSNTSHDRFNQNNNGQFNNQNRDANGNFHNDQNRDANGNFNRSNTSGQVNDNHLNTNTNANSSTKSSTDFNSTNRNTSGQVNDNHLNTNTNSTINQGNQQPTNASRPNDRSTTSSTNVKTETRPNDRSVPSTPHDTKTLDSTTHTPTNTNTQSSNKDSSRPNDRSTTPDDSKK